MRRLQQVNIHLLPVLLLEVKVTLGTYMLQEDGGILPMQFWSCTTSTREEFPRGLTLFTTGTTPFHTCFLQLLPSQCCDQFWGFTCEDKSLPPYLFNKLTWGGCHSLVPGFEFYMEELYMHDHCRFTYILFKPMHINSPKNSSYASLFLEAQKIFHNLFNAICCSLLWIPLKLNLHLWVQIRKWKIRGNLCTLLVLHAISENIFPVFLASLVAFASLLHSLNNVFYVRRVNQLLLCPILISCTNLFLLEEQGSPVSESPPEDLSE